MRSGERSNSSKNTWTNEECPDQQRFHTNKLIIGYAATGPFRSPDYGRGSRSHNQRGPGLLNRCSWEGLAGGCRRFAGPKYPNNPGPLGHNPRCPGIGSSGRSVVSCCGEQRGLPEEFFGALLSGYTRGGATPGRTAGGLRVWWAGVAGVEAQWPGLVEVLGTIETQDDGQRKVRVF